MREGRVCLWFSAKSMIAEAESHVVLRVAAAFGLVVIIYNTTRPTRSCGSATFRSQGLMNG